MYTSHVTAAVTLIAARTNANHANFCSLLAQIATDMSIIKNLVDEQGCLTKEQAMLLYEGLAGSVDVIKRLAVDNLKVPYEVIAKDTKEIAEAFVMRDCT